MNDSGILYSHVTEGNACDPDRERVRELRSQGLEVPEIAAETGLPDTQVTDYCRELGLPITGSCFIRLPRYKANFTPICQICGEEIKAGLMGRPKKYCSTACKNRAGYERRLRGNRGKQCVCLNCGKVFSYVAGSTGAPRRYCSRECYFEKRYGFYWTREEPT